MMCLIQFKHFNLSQIKRPGGCRLRASQCQRCHGGGRRATKRRDGDGGMGSQQFVDGILCLLVMNIIWLVVSNMNFMFHNIYIYIII